MSTISLLAISSICMLGLFGCGKKEEKVQVSTFVAAEVPEIEINTLPENVFVHVETNLYMSPDSLELGDLIYKGSMLPVEDAVYDEDGEIRFYKVKYEGQGSYIRPWYVRENEIEANAVFDEALYAMHATRGDKYGGGEAADVDLEPRDKNFKYRGDDMPELARTLYMPATKNCLDNVDKYIEAAKTIGANAIVIDIVDNTVVGYQSEVMKKISPSAYYSATYGREKYASIIKKLHDAGLYTIGRMTAFRDGPLCEDHPEYSISAPDGSLKIITGGYWPSAYCRDVWEYKVAIAKEAAEWFEFDEIQFDYVRFPDGTVRLEKDYEVDMKNEYSESRVDAITRFLMYAVDNIHESGVYVSADVFGETANDYVAAYGQYWPAISNVVDVISAMPYPDHYERTETWVPWTEPYTTISRFAKNASKRQLECPTPAKDRTWIQCYDTKKDPATQYDAHMVGQEIQALYDNGMTGGFITWNSYGDSGHYVDCKAALAMNPGDQSP